MKLTCLRHGATPMNLAHRINGMRQEGITDAQRQALEQTDFDASAFDVIYCSHLLRTVETARALRIESWIIDDRHAERNLGVFEGLTDTECQMNYSEAYASFRRFDAHFVIPGGESRAQHLTRVLAWLEEASRYHSVLAITHGGTLDFLIRMGSGIPLHGGDEIYGTPNASISTFEVIWPDVELIDTGIALADWGRTGRTASR